MEKHLRDVHRNEKDRDDGKEYKCKYCEVKSPYKFVIKRHVETHKQSMGWECGECGKKYVSGQGLKLHQKLKHSGTPTECGYCGKAFSCEEYMRMHERLYCKMKRLEEETRAKMPAENNGQF